MSDQLSDEQLLQHIVAGGKHGAQATETLFRRYYPLFRSRLLHKWHLPADRCEDITQDVFIKIINKAETIYTAVSDGGNAKSYLYRMLEFQTTDTLRQDKRQPQQVSLDRNIDQSADNAGDGVSFADTLADDKPTPDDEIGDCLQHAFRQFSEQQPGCSSAIEMAAEGYRIDDIATVLDRTNHATRQYLSECRKKLKKLIQTLCPGVMD